MREHVPHSTVHPNVVPVGANIGRGASYIESVRANSLIARFTKLRGCMKRRFAGTHGLWRRLLGAQCDPLWGCVPRAIGGKADGA